MERAPKAIKAKVETATPKPKPKPAPVRKAVVRPKPPAPRGQGPMRVARDGSWAVEEVYEARIAELKDLARDARDY
ncbi:hypothetical protein [Phenylobacterium sp.]|uniref:hypothetical protein n=1 Tax=Phenylobacterium sp. TaxID=1871053 RepID=UPI00391ACF82